MLRTFFSLFVAGAFLMVGLATASQNTGQSGAQADQTKQKQSNQNQNQTQSDKNKASSDANKKGDDATITHIDQKKGTVTVKMKDKNGKEVEKTFHLTETMRAFDSSGHAAAMDVFQAGNRVLVIEAEGQLREMHQKANQNNQGNQKSNTNNSGTSGNDRK